jgi:cation:H+ antiporter
MPTIIISITILIASLAGLILSSQFIINTIEKFMELTKKSETIIGFIILAAISSFAELTVAIFSIIERVPGIAVGDIFGSHLFNICIVIGILSILGFFKNVHEKTLIEMVDVLVLASIIPILLLISEFRQILANGSIFIGVILISIYFISMYSIGKARIPFLTEEDKLNKDNKISGNSIINKKEKIKLLVKIFSGGAIVVISGRFTIYSAVIIIEYFELVPIAFGAKIISIGTSLPELVICYLAAKKGKVNLALADAIGANLTTSTLILGIVLVFSPFTINLLIFTELILFIIIVNIILWRFLMKGEIPPYIGIILILIYIVFQAVVSF